MAHADTIPEAPFAPMHRPKWFGLFHSPSVLFGRARRLENSLPQMDAHMMRDIGLSPDAHQHPDPSVKATRIFYGIHN